MDANGDGRPDLYVANDANPNRLYLNVPFKGGAAADPLGLGFRLEESAASVGLADPNAGMGIAAGDYSGDGRPDIVVTNSHKQLHAVFRSNPPSGGSASYSDARADIASAFDTRLAGWGVVLGRSRQRHEPRSGARERRHPGDRPRSRARSPCRHSRTSPRTITRASSPPRRRRSGSGSVPEVNGRGARRGRLRQRRARRSRRQLDRRQADAAPQHGREGQLARGRATPLRARRGRHGRAAERPHASCRRSTPAAATSRPRIPERTSGSGRRRGWTS